MVPSEASQRGSFELAFWLSEPPAEPVATVFASAEPVCIVAQPDKPTNKPSAAAPTKPLFFMEQPFQNGNWKRDSEKDNTIGRKFRTTVRFAVSA